MQFEVTHEKEQVIIGNDSIVIRKYNGGIPGGRVLDVTDFSGEVIYAGHVIIKHTDSSTGAVTYKPMPVVAATETTEEGYGTLPTDCAYVGVLYRSVSVDAPAAAIMYDGVVNPNLIPYKMDSILDAFKAAVPQIIFEQDEEA